MNPLKFIDQIKDMYNDQDPRPMAHGPRNMYAGGQLVTPSVDGSRPGYNGEDKLAGNIKIKGSGGFNKGVMFHGLYSDVQLMKDMRKGKYLKEIAQSIYDKNPEYFDNWKKVKEGVVKKGQPGKFHLDPVFQIIEGMKQRLKGSNPKLLNFVNRREDKLIKDVNRDVLKFVKDNKSKHTNPHRFYNAVIDFIDNKYPKFIETSDIRDLNLKNQKTLPGKVRLPGAKPRGGAGSAYRDLQRLVHNTLGIDYEIIKSLEGGNVTKSTWIKAVEQLLPIAQKKGLLPKTFKSPLTGKEIKLTPNSYRKTYMTSQLTDPLFEVFGGKVNWSVEHPGGMGRSVIKGFEDPKTLRHALPIQSFKETLKPVLGQTWAAQSPNIIKGNIDAGIKRNLELASRAIDSSKRARYITAANDLSTKANKVFGTEQVIYGWKNGEFTRKYPKLTLEDNLLNKTKSAIQNFIFNKNLDLRTIPSEVLKNSPELKKAIKNNKKILGTLPEKLQEAIKLIEAGKPADKILNSHLKDIIKTGKNVKAPGRVKALQYLVSLGIGTGFAGAIGFSPTEVKAAEAQAAEPGAAADYKWMFDSGLSAKDRAKIFGTAVAGDLIVKKGALTKASMKGLWKTLPFIWTPMGDAAIGAYSHFSKTEPKLEDFAEGFKEAGYDINSEEFQKQWNSIPKDERKEILYEAAGKVIDKRSTGEKVLEKAESPWTHAQYAFWKSGVESMQKLLAASPGNSALANKLKQAALFGIRMGIPMQVLKTISPIGWTLTAGTAGYKMKNWADENLQWKPLTEQQQTDIQERKTAVPRMLDKYEQVSQRAKEQGISYEEALKQFDTTNVPGINFIDFSLPKPVETLAGGGMVGIRKPHAIAPTGGPQSQGLASTPEYGTYNKEYKWQI